MLYKNLEIPDEIIFKTIAHYQETRNKVTEDMSRYRSEVIEALEHDPLCNWLDGGHPRELLYNDRPLGKCTFCPVYDYISSIGKGVGDACGETPMFRHAIDYEDKEDVLTWIDIFLTALSQFEPQKVKEI